MVEALGSRLVAIAWLLLGFGGQRSRRTQPVCLDSGDTAVRDTI